jgi:ribosomal protein S27E
MPNMIGINKRWTFHLLFLALVCYVPTSIHALKAFKDPLELQAAVDVILSKEPVAVADIEATYGLMEDWDVSAITDFTNLFNAKTRNPLAATIQVDLSRWDVGNAKSLDGMFLGAAMVNFDVSSWDVSNTELFQGMFEGATSFKGKGLEKWDVSSGRLFMVMFAETTSLSPGLDLRSWNVHNAERMTAMFRNSNFGTSSLDDSRWFATRNGQAQRLEDLPHNLCDWAWRLSPSADTESMFLNSQCPDTADPQLVTRSASSVSFCVPCGVLPPPPTSTPIERPSSADRPNVLLIVADQMRFDMIRAIQETLQQYDGHYKINTPNLDKLMRQGAHFESAYCQCAVCAPARATIRTGYTIERTGVQHNDLIHESEYKKSAIFQERIESMESIDHILVDKLGYVSE